MKQELTKIINQFNGNVLAIGLDKNLINQLEKNNCIKDCYLLDGSVKNKTVIKGKTKTIRIKKIRKHFNKKSVDFILVNYESLHKYLNTFVKDSIYLNGFKLYYYGKTDDIQDLINRYKRYQVEVNLIDKKDYFILEIDNSHSKNNWFRDFIYRIVDGFNWTIELIGDILMN